MWGDENLCVCVCVRVSLFLCLSQRMRTESSGTFMLYFPKTDIDTDSLTHLTLKSTKDFGCGCIACELKCMGTSLDINFDMNDTVNRKQHSIGRLTEATANKIQFMRLQRDAMLD